MNLSARISPCISTARPFSRLRDSVLFPIHAAVDAFVISVHMTNAHAQNQRAVTVVE